MWSQLNRDLRSAERIVKTKMPSTDGLAEKSFRIKEDGGFFSRLVAKEASMANSSSRVLYYGEASVGVPFRWESKPGTPKHPLSETSLPPLTPPPSYTSKSKPNPRNPNKKTTRSIISGISRALLAGSGKVHVSPSSSYWSSSSSSLSLGYSSPSSFSVRSATSKLGSAFRYKNRRSGGFRSCAPNLGNAKSLFLKMVGA
ncbi:uncharacterized protein LOC129304237 [Prosopis cineraria]|uniref:uncharacterized protein LOC129296166 n=1 Tax=Prosopis cineraria TaxID=364024 RepID=UPI00241082C3|nr:uncharacterized protein LOC129296166 [Prosopis cineraria]XP_054799905.1 uncharacterized protein LOC129304237 [Prosopis cineraria]